MKTNNKKEYTAPQLTVVSFKNERGYAASNYSALLFWLAPATAQTEDFEIRSGWEDDGSNNFF